MQFEVVIIQDKTGGYVGLVPELPGVTPKGTTWKN